VTTDEPRQPGSGEETPQRPLRILILNQPFHPDLVATAQIAKELADALVGRGHSVTAIASRSIYGEAGAALPKRETVDGIEIIRVSANRFGKSSTFGRLVDFASYYALAAARGLFSTRFDVVIALTTPPYIGLAAGMMRTFRGARFIYWVMDVYPDVMVAHGMVRDGSVTHRLLRRLHRSILKRADATVALGRCMRDRLLAHGAPEDRVHIIRPWSPAPDQTPPLRDSNPYRVEWNVGERVLVMYSGNFGLAHDVDTFLAAAERLRDDDRVRFAFVGGGKRKPIVETFVREKGLDNCVVAPYQPLDRLHELLAAADVHLVSMEPEMSGLVVPSKFFGIAGAGRPAVFIGPASSEVARCVDEWDCGRVVEPGDVDGLIAVLTGLAERPEALDRMGWRAREGFAGAAERSVCTRGLAALVEGATPRAASDQAPVKEASAA